jgi:hypothetical protein
MQCMRGTLALKFEHEHAAVMACGEQIDLGMSSQDPEAFMLTAEGLQGRAPGHVPDADGAVLTVAYDDILPAAEYDTRHVVHVTSQRVHFPCLAVCTRTSCNCIADTA